jgi:hypothetical protein
MKGPPLAICAPTLATFANTAILGVRCLQKRTRAGGHRPPARAQRKLM